MQYNVVLQLERNVYPGTTDFPFDIGKFANATYLLQTSDGTEKHVTTSLQELSTFNPAHQTQLDQLQVQLKDLNPSLLANEIRQLRSSILELTALSQTITNHSTILSENTLTRMETSRIAIDELEKRGQKGLADIIAGKNIGLGDSSEFHSFLTAAEEYIKKMQAAQYPQENEPCIYCQQPLSAESVTLLSSYRQLLNDTTKAQLDKLRKDREVLIKKVTDTVCKYVLHQSSFGSTADEIPVQPTELSALFQQMELYKRAVQEHSLTERFIFSISYATALQVLAEKSNALSQQLKAKEESLATITTKENELLRQIEELNDRHVFSTKQNDLKALITNNQIVGKLRTSSAKFNSKAISIKTSEAREALVKQQFNSLFKNEMLAFGRSHISVDLDFGTQKGQSQVKQKIQSCALSDVLSEGEQKAIAMSQFLTELQLDNSQVPVIFDDPVNSLDHNIIDYVSRRLIELSMTRQVVIFTHSILFYNSILQKSESVRFKHLSFKYYESQTDLSVTGILYSTMDGKKETFGFYEKLIKALIELPAAKRTKTENDMAIEGYGKLRSAIEVFVEDNVFNNTVRRYRKNVAMTAFPKINGVLIDECKDEVNEIFERCCGYIDGHSNPDGAGYKPTLQGLQQDLVLMQTIKKKFPQH